MIRRGIPIGSYRVRRRFDDDRPVWRVEQRVLDRQGGQVVGRWVFKAEGTAWGQQLLQITGQSPYGRECDCYPWGVNPDSYEGPQRHCAVHNPWQPCSRCGKPCAYLDHADGGPGQGWRHIFPADDRQMHVGYPMPRER